MNKKDADQTVRMRRLVFAFVVRKPRRQVFLRRGSFYNVELCVTLNILPCHIGVQQSTNSADIKPIFFTMKFIIHCRSMGQIKLSHFLTQGHSIQMPGKITEHEKMST